MQGGKMKMNSLALLFGDAPLAVIETKSVHFRVGNKVAILLYWPLYFHDFTEIGVWVSVYVQLQEYN